jgi:hypothetical protein
MQSYVFERKHDAQMREETVSLYNKHSTISKINKYQKFVDTMDNIIFLSCTYFVSIKIFLGFQDAFLLTHGIV